MSLRVGEEIQEVSRSVGLAARSEFEPRAIEGVVERSQFGIVFSRDVRQTQKSLIYVLPAVVE